MPDVVSVPNFIEVGNERHEYFIKRIETEIVSSVKDASKVDKVLDIKGKQPIQQCRFKLNTLITARGAFSVTKDGIKREIQNTISKFPIECEDCIVEYFEQSLLLIVQNISPAKQQQLELDHWCPWCCCCFKIISTKHNQKCIESTFNNL